MREPIALPTQPSIPTVQRNVGIYSCRSEHFQVSNWRSLDVHERPRTCPAIDTQIGTHAPEALSHSIRCSEFGLPTQLLHVRPTICVRET